MLALNATRIFNQPVDTVRLNIPAHTRVIKNPMDLGTVRQKLVAGEYEHRRSRTVRLTFEMPSNSIPRNIPFTQRQKCCYNVLRMCAAKPRRNLFRLRNRCDCILASCITEVRFAITMLKMWTTGCSGNIVWSVSWSYSIFLLLSCKWMYAELVGMFCSRCSVECTNGSDHGGERTNSAEIRRTGSNPNRSVLDPRR